MEGLLALSTEVFSSADNLDGAFHDFDDEIRLKAAQGLANLGSSGGRGVENLATILQEDKVDEIRMAAAAALGSIFRDGCNPGRAKCGIPSLVKALRHDRVRKCGASPVGHSGPSLGRSQKTPRPRCSRQ